MKTEKDPTIEEIRKQNIRVALTRADFMTQMPRFYKAFDYVDQWPNDAIDTLCVAPIYDKDSKELTGYHDFMWSPKYVATLTDKQLMGVQMHELMHILLGHTTTRTPKYKSMYVDKSGVAKLDPKSDSFKEDAAMAELWNIACDLAINCLIKNYLKDPQGPKVGIFPAEGQFAQLPEFRTAEFYFEELKKQHAQDMKDLQKLMEKLKKMFGEGKIGDHGEWIDADGQGKVKKESATKAGGKSAEEIDGKDKGTDESDAPTADEIAKEFEEIAEQLGMGGLKAGTSGATSKVVDLSAGKERKTPGWMRKTTHASVHGFEVAPIATRKVPNRRYGILFPGKKRVAHQNKCLVAVDVSGSISRPLLNKFTEHLNKLERHAKFDLIFFNHSLLTVEGKEIGHEQAEQGFVKWKKGMNFYAGGGTDFEPVVRMWNRVKGKYDSLFIFTDGEANYNSAILSPRSVNWILYASSQWYKDAIKHGNKYDIRERGEDYD